MNGGEIGVTKHNSPPNRNERQVFLSIVWRSHNVHALRLEVGDQDEDDDGTKRDLHRRLPLFAAMKSSSQSKCGAFQSTYSARR